MTNRYQWSEANIQALRNASQNIHDGLAETLTLVTELTLDMAADTSWSGEHKNAFIAWMDLLRQYHAKLADPGVGPASVTALNNFLEGLNSFYANSPAHSTLRSVQ